jgi:hypothetical protein
VRPTISGLKRTTGLKRTGFKNKSSSQLKRTGFKQKSYEETLTLKKLAESKKTISVAAITPKKVQKNKSVGLSGIGRNKAEKGFHSRVSTIGCLACLILGETNRHTLRIHHADGRKQKLFNDYSEWKVIPLCDQHHRPDISFAVNGIKLDMEQPSVHTRKKRFTRLIGTEEELMLLVYAILDETPPWVTRAANKHDGETPSGAIDVEALIENHRLIIAERNSNEFFNTRNYDVL